MNVLVNDFVQVNGKLKWADYRAKKKEMERRAIRGELDGPKKYIDVEIIPGVHGRAVDVIGKTEAKAHQPVAPVTTLV